MELTMRTPQPQAMVSPQRHLTPLRLNTPSLPALRHPSAHLTVSASASSAGTKPGELVQLGKTGISVPPLGVGAWAWGDKFFWNEGEWDSGKETGAREAYRACVDLGLGLVDTAEVYGTKQFGAEDSETLLGRFMREGDGGALVATKFASLPWRLGRGAVVKACKDSLSRLGLKQIDLYQIHWPGVWGTDAFVDGLGDCVEQGLVRAVGVSNFKEDRLRKAHKQLAARGVPLASNQVHYNILYRVPEENGVKAACQELGVTLVAYSPLAQGMLSGKYTADNPPKGPRGVSYSTEYLTKMQPLLSRMRELGAKYGDKTLVQVALNWLLSQGNIVPIPGAKSAQQVREFAGAIGWSLEKEEVEELRQLGKSVPLIQGFPAERL